MSSPFVGEIRVFGFDYAPPGWALCNGALVPISEYTALFSMIGPKYGGNGVTDFALPNLPDIQNQGAPAQTAYYIATTGTVPPR
ncbi:MAG TPA: tail fiber protein [Allosphingosinicella sp.]|nr:tail fiber protein [Allosphingosinicella sp.]